jgi:multisubunit Na+/H+ antiporter MnhG subunit
MVRWVLLAAGTAIELIAVLGLVAMRDAFDRLHYVGLAGYGAVLVGISVFLAHPFSLIGDKALLTGAVLVLLSPVVMHVTARSFRTAGRGRGHGPRDDRTKEVHR